MGLRQINTCRKVPLQVNFLDDDILHCLPWVLSFYGEGQYMKEITSEKVSKTWLTHWLYSISFYFPNQMYPSTTNTYSFHSDFSSICQNISKLNFLLLFCVVKKWKKVDIDWAKLEWNRKKMLAGSWQHSVWKQDDDIFLLPFYLLITLLIQHSILRIFCTLSKFIRRGSKQLIYRVPAFRRIFSAPSSPPPPATDDNGALSFLTDDDDDDEKGGRGRDFFVS